MRTIIAGCRTLRDPFVLGRAIVEAQEAFRKIVPSFEITCVLSGAQATFDRNGNVIGGTDWLGERWAEAEGIPVERYPANWDDVTAPGAVVRHSFRGRGPYNAMAGPDRNAMMLASADAIVAVWDKRSRGTGDMIRQALAAKKAGKELLIHVHLWNLK